MDPALLLDLRLLFIVCLAGAVSMLTTLNVAARPAAVRTGKRAMANSVSQIFFTLTRFANLFYLPILATYVDEAVRSGRTDILYGQIQWVVLGAAGGALLSWLLLPTFVAIYERGIAAAENRSMLRVLLSVPSPRGLRALFGCLRRPSMMEARPFRLDGVPADFLLWNTAASAVWTVGALCALYVSAIVPQYEATAILLSGLVNAFAAIAFTLFVDPKAGVLTDQATATAANPVPRRSARDISVMTFYLGAGNFVGSLLGLAVLPFGIRLIEWATLQLGSEGGTFVDSMWMVVILNVLVTLLASTTVVARISAAVTGHVMTAFAVYNFFFLITRLAQQVYAPVLGSVRDTVIAGHAQADTLLPLFRQVIGGASLGVLAGWLLIPTFVQVYNRAIAALEKRDGSTAALFVAMLNPRRWLIFFRCLRMPSMMGVTLKDLGSLPRNFLIGNVLVLGVHTIGVLAAIYAGAMLSSTLARTATLLSSVINGVATIMMTVIVDPTAARITDQATHGERPVQHVYAMAVFLIAGMLLGTLLSQLFFVPAAHVIALCAQAMDALFRLL